MTTGTLRKTARGALSALAILLFVSFALVPARAAETPAAAVPGHIEKASAALARDREDEARFWIACYLGEVLRSGDDRFRADLLAPLLDRLGVKPTAFLSGRFDAGFLDFFMLGSWSLWACAEAPKDFARNRILMAKFPAGTRYVAFWGTPALEVRILIGGPHGLRRMLLAPSGETHVVVGRYGEDGAPEPEAEWPLDAGPVQYIVDAGFADIDGDGSDDLFLRYNRLTVSGFAQVLDIFGPDGKGGFLRRYRFEGEAEGYARRLGDGRVEVARGIDAQGEGHLANDRERVEIWRVRGGRPVKEKTRTTPHRLLEKGWEHYYLSQR